MVCLRSTSTLLGVTCCMLASSISTAFTAVMPQHLSTRGSISTSSTTAAFMSSSLTSSDFELPEDGPNKRGSSSESSSEEDVRRRAQQVEEKTRFVTGDALHQLREKVLGMRQSLQDARKQHATRRVQELERAIIQAQQMDAEFVYSVAHERMLVAKEAGLTEEALHWEEESRLARAALPHFNLEGLWVGKYGDHGYEMINVTYIGDTLVAHKVTGDKNVPRGEVTFTADLSPDSEQLDPIELGEGAANQWGSKFLHRFAGSGQVAAEGFKNSQWMEGHLIMVGDYFSFAWLPIGHQVFFGRPSAELTLKLLRDNSTKSEDDQIRDYLEKCLEETESLEDEMEVQDSPFFAQQQDYYGVVGCFE